MVTSLRDATVHVTVYVIASAIFNGTTCYALYGLTGGLTVSRGVLGNSKAKTPPPVRHTDGLG